MPKREFDFDDLGGVDLSKLDLEHIELELEDRPNPWWRWFMLVLLLGLGALVLWFPTSGYYQTQSHANWLFFLLCTGALVLGISVGRWLWEWAQEAARAYGARRAREERRVVPAEPPSALRRFVTLVVVLGGAVSLLVWLPASGYLQAGGIATGVYFLAAITAVITGILFGRWILMQGEAAARTAGPQAPAWRLPPWFKWVTLAVLVIAGGAALAAPMLMGGSLSHEVRFGLGGLGFACGIVGAIWIARRFDEVSEKAIKNKRHRAG